MVGSLNHENIINKKNKKHLKIFLLKFNRYYNELLQGASLEIDERYVRSLCNNIALVNNRRSSITATPHIANIPPRSLLSSEIKIT
jgi:hypothetical protein